ncbi:MAG: DnaJ domain-containing protein [Chloroflexi bacterium]|nr:DnaJ domain-containing protein [Chloroflexota bacterium]
MPLPDYYSILEVSSNATLAQIKRSYRRLARLYHPDLNKDARDTRIKQLNEAYDILSNAAKRNAYDIQRLEEIRRALLLDMLRRRQEEARREPKMTWTEGVVGFVKELKKGLQDE